MNETRKAIRSEFVRINDDFTIHFEESGSGNIPVVFIPGWTMSTKVFARRLTYFSGSLRYRAIAYDPRGQGLTTKAVEGHSYQQHGRDLGAFIAALGLQRVVLVGWSYGVPEALAYLDQFGTDNLRALVVLDGTPKPQGNDPTTEWVVDSAESGRWGTITPMEDRAGFIRAFAEWLLEDTGPENVAWIADLGCGDRSPERNGALCQLRAALHRRNETAARAGRRGQVADWLQANAPTVPLVVMGKHMMFWERARAFNPELEEFLDTLAQQSGCGDLRQLLAHLASRAQIRRQLARLNPIWSAAAWTGAVGAEHFERPKDLDDRQAQDHQRER